MKSLLITGYNAGDLGIFKDDDPKIAVIKHAIADKLEHYRDEGVEWLIFTGALGFEYYALQVAKEQFAGDFQTAALIDFETHADRWKEANQAKFQLFKSCDFVKFSFPAYESPQQFRAHTAFILDNTDGALVLYDEERETRLHYTLDAIRQLPNYPLDTLSFEDLQDVAENMAE